MDECKQICSKDQKAERTLKLVSSTAITANLNCLQGATEMRYDHHLSSWHSRFSLVEHIFHKYGHQSEYYITTVTPCRFFWVSTIMREVKGDGRKRVKKGQQFLLKFLVID